MEIPKFENREELFKWLKTNKSDLIYTKKSQMKKADAFSTFTIPLNSNINKQEATTQVENNDGIIKRRCIINTTYVRDSHKDVHIDGLWNKTVKENKMIKHLQEHQMSFDKVIADKEDLEVFVKTYSWKDLGYQFDGKTEALVFDSTIRKDRNEVMFKEYEKNNVDNHSVGMIYDKIKLAINSTDEDYKEEKAEYDKHIDKIANKEEVEEDGYFWAVYEAKALEGSAVLVGSNRFTPTQEIKRENTEISTIKSWLGIDG